MPLERDAQHAFAQKFFFVFSVISRRGDGHEPFHAPGQVQRELRHERAEERVVYLHAVRVRRGVVPLQLGVEQSAQSGELQRRFVRFRGARAENVSVDAVEKRLRPASGKNAPAVPLAQRLRGEVGGERQARLVDVQVA